MIKVATNLEKFALSIREESPLYMRPVSGILGRALGSPNTAITLGSLAPFRAGPDKKEKYIKELVKTLAKDKNLDQTEVYLNDVHPLDNIAKVWKNKRTGVGTKLLGTLLSPITDAYAALLRADHYNPFADTASVFTNEPGIVAHEIGHAQDINSQDYPGLYTLARMAPIINLGVIPYQEYAASRNAVKTLQKTKGISKNDLDHAGSLLSAGMGSYVGSLAGQLAGGLPLRLPAAWAGRLAGGPEVFADVESSKSKSKTKKKKSDK